jgi:hypothetical protein
MDTRNAGGDMERCVPRYVSPDLWVERQSEVEVQCLEVTGLRAAEGWKDKVTDDRQRRQIALEPAHLDQRARGVERLVARPERPVDLCELATAPRECGARDLIGLDLLAHGH